MGAKYFGAAVRRREDPRFLRGEGRFLDDVRVAGLLHVAFLRSPYAHAMIRAIRTERARAAPAVVAVFTFADLESWMKPLPLFGAPPPGLAAAIAFEIRQAPQFALCRDRARYVGEIVAMVVAESRARAEDAAEAIEVDWEPRSVVTDMRQAAEPGTPLVHEAWGTNVGVGFTHAIGDVEAAFARADVTVSETFNIQRYVGMPLEGRGAVAVWDRRDGTLTTWNSTQVSHFVQQGLAPALGLPPHKIRVIAPDLAGGFGTKASPYPGAGRPETVFAMDRIVDCLARELRIDPAELRRRNYIRPEEMPYDFGMPYRDGNPLVYDTGDFPLALEKALEAADYRQFRAE